MIDNPASQIVNPADNIRVSYPASHIINLGRNFRVGNPAGQIVAFAGQIVNPV